MDRDTPLVSEAQGGAGTPEKPSVSPPPFTETELKLAAAPDVIDRLRHCGLVGRLALGPEETASIVSTYYDTSGRLLRDREAVLRVRHAGGKTVQTLKAGRAGVLDRSEWDAPLKGDKPDPAAFTPADAMSHLDGIAAADLAALFTTHIERTTRMVRPPGEEAVEEVVALVFDRGAVAVGDRNTPISEIELELHHGARASLYDLGLALHAIEPLTIETLPKAARGFALAGEVRPGWSKPGIPELPPDATVEQAFAAILASCYGHWMANQAAALNGGDPEGIHQLRVAMRRLRAVLSAFKAACPGPRRKWLQDEAKWLAGSLGPARDWDVFLTDLLPAARKALKDGQDRTALQEAAETERRHAYEGARAAITSERATTFLLTLGGWIEGRRWRDDAAEAGESTATLDRLATELAAAVLDRHDRKVRKRGRRFAKLDAGDRHKLRIALKKLRYPAEFFRSLYDRKAASRFTKALRRLQDGLGHQNDVAVADRLLDTLVEDGRAGRLALAEETVPR
ncbi:MAG: CHAD domain-containing protein, partial [Alphaproteobacteria bacterium]|nr:CHAD domain-containing protein [Alphaproteobacteria bacterium]